VCACYLHSHHLQSPIEILIVSFIAHPRHSEDDTHHEGYLAFLARSFVATCALLCFDVLAAGVHTMTPEALKKCQEEGGPQPAATDASGNDLHFSPAGNTTDTHGHST